MNVGLQEARDLVLQIAQCVKRRNGHFEIAGYGGEREREWHKLLGLNVRFDLLPHALGKPDQRDVLSNHGGQARLFPRVHVVANPVVGHPPRLGDRLHPLVEAVGAPFLLL
jgi:hypothetical protein